MKNYSVLARAAFAVVLAVFPFSLFAFGGFIHRTIAEIASRHLDQDTLDQMSKLALSKSIAEIATWPDEVRRTSEWAHTAFYHYEGMDDGETYLSYLKRLTPAERKRAGAGLAILQAEDDLLNLKLPDSERAVALKFLVHLLGDVFQPLHTGPKEDKGGNDVPINWFGKKTDLHSLWDSGLVQTAHKGIFTGNSMKDGIAYANLLEKGPPLEPIAWNSSYLGDWLERALALRPGVYSKDVKNNQQKYLEANIQIVDLQVRTAGYVLASLLQRIFKPNAVLPAFGVQFRKEVLNALGEPYDSWVDYKPAAAGSSKASLAELEEHGRCPHLIAQARMKKRKNT